jgi:2-polyprenyl-3-methyl-5-hydroxy-6-metoxy-1,4-benzoquinol methylase
MPAVTVIGNPTTTSDELRSQGTRSQDVLGAALTPEEATRRDTFVGRVFQSLIQANELLTVYLGERLGLYQALANSGPLTSGALAARAGIHERYAREWLEQQAVAGILEVEDAQAEASARRYRLPPGHAAALLHRDSLTYVATLPRVLAGFASPLPALINAFRAGGGVPFSDYGVDIHEVQAELNRPMYVNLLATQWLPAISDVHARLHSDPPARVADIACGGGWSSIVIAQAYPNVHVDGFDVDESAIALARRNAAEAGVADRVSFHAHDATHPIDGDRYDLVTIFEAIHDMPRPVEVLRTIRGMLAAGGAVIVADERVPETFTTPGTDLDRLFYTTSVLLCLPTGMAEQPSAGTGTVMRPATFRRYATEAGFRTVEILPIENDVWRFYRLTP